MDVGVNHINKDKNKKLTYCALLFRDMLLFELQDFGSEPETDWLRILT